MPAGEAPREDPIVSAGEVGDAVLRVRRRIGERVQLRRRQLKLSQEQLAEHVGFSPNYIAHVERGSRGISLTTLVRLARGLRASLAHLVAPPGRADRARRCAGRDRRPSVRHPAE